MRKGPLPYGMALCYRSVVLDYLDTALSGRDWLFLALGAVLCILLFRINLHLDEMRDYRRAKEHRRRGHK